MRVFFLAVSSDNPLMFGKKVNSSSKDDDIKSSHMLLY